MRLDYSYPLRVSADRYPDRPVFVHRDRAWTYREFEAATDRLASSFKARGLAGHRVAFLLNNEPLTVLVYLALARVGATAVAINPRLLLEEIAFIVENSGATTLIADAEYLEQGRELAGRYDRLEGLWTANVEPGTADGERVEDLIATGGAGAAEDVDSESLAMLVYTSGTSGFPKGVMRTHEANLWTCANSMIGQPRFADDVEVFVLPLFGIAFIFQVMPMIMAGGTTILDGAFNPARTWDLLEQHRATRVFLAPTMLDSMLAVDGHERRDLSSLRVLNTAYEFPERVRERAVERFGNIIAYMYGLTEAQLCVSTPSEFADDPSNAGAAMGMMRVRVVDEKKAPMPTGEIGEIAMQGPSVMRGYYGREDATAEVLEDGWLYTGDLGYLDDRGRVHIAGRKKEIIKSGGFSVDPVEVERAILDSPGVIEAAVVGAPDEHWGEVVVAFVACTEKVDVSESELLSFVKSRVAGFKSPKHVVFLPALPKNPMGKIERARLRKQAAQITAAPTAS